MMALGYMAVAFLAGVACALMLVAWMEARGK